MCGKKKHKILFMNHWAQHTGGAELSLIDIIKETSKYEKTYLISSENGKLIEESGKSGTECIIIPFEKSLSLLRRDNLFLLTIVNWKVIISFLFYILKCKREISRLSPDIIHANVPKSHVILFLLYLTGYSGKMVFHIREIFAVNSFAYFIYHLLFPSRNAKAIAVSNAVFRSLPKRIRNRTSVIYNGVNVNTQIKCRLSKDPQFLYLGRIVPWKGCDLLINAFAKLVNKYACRAGNLDLVGGTFYWDESYREKLKLMISDCHLDGRVNLLPYTDRTEDVYGSHDIFCIASTREPFGRVVAEAQGWGLPVIAFNSGAISEIVIDKESGFLVNTFSCDLFFNAMANFIENPSLITTMGIAGQKRIQKLFCKNQQIPLIVKSITEMD